MRNHARASNKNSQTRFFVRSRVGFTLYSSTPCQQLVAELSSFDLLVDPDDSISSNCHSALRNLKKLQITLRLSKHLLKQKSPFARFLESSCLFVDVTTLGQLFNDPRYVSTVV